MEEVSATKTTKFVQDRKSPLKELEKPKKVEAFHSLLEKEEEKKKRALESPDETVVVPLPTPFDLCSESAKYQYRESAPVEKSAPTFSTLCEVPQGVCEVIHQMKSDGVTETTWTIQTRDIQELEIIIRHYDTAPDSYSIEIAAPPENQALLQKELPSLEMALKAELASISCHLAPVVIGENFREYFSSPRGKKHKQKEDRKKIVQSSSFIYSPNSEGTGV